MFFSEIYLLVFRRMDLVEEENDLIRVAIRLIFLRIGNLILFIVMKNRVGVFQVNLILKLNNIKPM